MSVVTGVWKVIVGFALLYTPVARAQMDPYGGGGGMPGAGDQQPNQRPVDENEKIREKAGADDTETRIKKKRPTQPEELYAEAEKALDRGYYTKAQEYLERIRIRFPFSPYATLADLMIADVYMEKGEYAMAVEAFKDFRKLHPNHEKIPYAVYMTAYGEFKQSPKWAARDQASTRRALEILNGAPPPRVREGRRYEELYPTSPHIAEVQALRQEGYERLARQVFLIGRFYFKRARFAKDEQKVGAYQAAIRRLDDIERDYPNTTVLPDARLLRIRCLAELDRWQEAAAVNVQLQKDSPDSRQARRAQLLLRQSPPVPVALGSSSSPASP